MGQPFKLLLNPPHARKKKKTFLQNIIKEKKGIKKKHRKIVPIPISKEKSTKSIVRMT